MANQGKSASDSVSDRDSKFMKQRTATAKSGSPKINFFSDTYNELKKVTWLSRRETIYLTGIVILVTVIVGAILALVDFGFSELINRVFLGG
jgi:preprotein translocase subunit SecE